MSTLEFVAHVPCYESGKSFARFGQPFHLVYVHLSGRTIAVSINFRSVAKDELDEIGSVLVSDDSRMSADVGIAFHVGKGSIREDGKSYNCRLNSCKITTDGNRQFWDNSKPTIMKSGKIIGIILLLAGIALIVYGVTHMDSTESKIKDFFGKEDSTGMFTCILGAVLAIAGGFFTVRK